jgi:hypothetical protein
MKSYNWRDIINRKIEEVVILFQITPISIDNTVLEQLYLILKRLESEICHNGKADIAG